MFLSLVTLLLVAVVGVLFVRERRSSRPADAPPDPLHISWLRFFRALRAHSGDFDAVLADFASDPAAVDAPVVRLPSVPLLPLPPLHFVVGEAALTDYHYSKELSMMEGLSLLIDNYAAKPSAGDAASRKSAQRMARAISPDKHATFIRVVWEELGKTIDAWPVEGQLDVFKDVYEFTTDLITKAVIGTDLKGEQLKQFIQDIRMVDPIEGLLVAPWAVLLPRWLFQLTSYGKELGNAHKRLFDAISGIADARIEKEAKGEPRKTDFFGYLIEVLGEEQEASIDGRSYNSEELTGMCVGLIFAANTNTFASACWSVSLLIRCLGRAKFQLIATQFHQQDNHQSHSLPRTHGPRQRRSRRGTSTTPRSHCLGQHDLRLPRLARLPRGLHPRKYPAVYDRSLFPARHVRYQPLRTVHSERIAGPGQGNLRAHFTPSFPGPFGIQTRTTLDLGRRRERDRYESR